MHFGLIKFCIPIDFEVLGSTTNSGVDDRYGLFKELIARGHQVTIFTPLVKGTRNNPKEERWLTGEESDVPENMKWIRNMGYAPGELPLGENRVDVLIAEAGVGNVMFRNNYYPDPESPEASLIRRFMHVIDAHKGPVIYMHCDPSLPFYFRQLAGRKYPWGHKRNGYTNPTEANRGEKWVRDSAWGTHDELFSEKTSIMLTRAVPEQTEFMIDNYSVDRAGYNEFKDKISFEYVPPAYAYDLCSDYQPNAIEYPLFYSGGDRRRRIAFRKYYEEMGVPTYVSGKWQEEAMETFDDINFMGWLEDRKSLLDTLNKAGCVVQIQPKDAAKMGWWTARTMEVPSCKSMCFIDGNIAAAEDLVFDKWFVLKNKEDAIKKIRTFLGLTMRERIQIIELQHSYCKTLFTWKRFADVFMSICLKYLGKSVVTRTLRKEYKDHLGVLLQEGTFNIVYPELPEYVHKEVVKKVDIVEEKIEQKNDTKLPFTDVPMEAFL